MQGTGVKRGACPGVPQPSHVHQIVCSDLCCRREYEAAAVPLPKEPNTCFQTQTVFLRVKGITLGCQANFLGVSNCQTLVKTLLLPDSTPTMLPASLQDPSKFYTQSGSISCISIVCQALCCKVNKTQSLPSQNLKSNRDRKYASLSTLIAV